MLNYFCEKPLKEGKRLPIELINLTKSTKMSFGIMINNYLNDHNEHFFINGGFFHCVEVGKIDSCATLNAQHVYPKVFIQE